MRQPSAAPDGDRGSRTPPAYSRARRGSGPSPARADPHPERPCADTHRRSLSPEGDPAGRASRPSPEARTVAWACRADASPPRRRRAPAGQAAARSDRACSSPEAGSCPVALVAERLRLGLAAATKDDRAVLRVRRRVDLVAVGINQTHLAADLVRAVLANLDLDGHPAASLT